MNLPVNFAIFFKNVFIKDVRTTAPEKCGYTNISDFEEVNVSWVSIYHNSQVLILKTDSFYSAFKFVDSKGSQGIL